MRYLTEKQKRFCDEYLFDLNATRAYMIAYPHVKNEKTAAAAASRLLRNVKVKAYIDEQLEKIHSEKTADAQEVMEYLTSVMRREELETVVVVCKKHKSHYDDNGKKVIDDVEEPISVSIPTKVSDANKAAELIGKRWGIFDKNNVEKDSSGIADFIEAAMPKGDEMKELFNDE